MKSMNRLNPSTARRRLTGSPSQENVRTYGPVAARCSPQEDRFDEQEEQDGVGQHVRQDLLGNPAQQGQQPGDDERQSDEEKDQRSSPLFH